jgi:uncharacterized protein YdeI (YjbR/CyaY-like superfamily)
MAAIVPPPHSIRAFESGRAFETWLAAHHDKESELYLRIYKKGSGVPTISYSQALDVALCWGWIETLDKANLYTLSWRLGTLKTAAGRAKKIAAFVELLKRGETLRPQTKKAT